jgi:hypothetical protein
MNRTRLPIVLAVVVLCMTDQRACPQTAEKIIAPPRPAGPSPTKSSKLVGTWKLVSIEERDSKGKLVTPLDYGPEPVGILMYDAAGHMSAQAMRRGRAPLDTEDVHRVLPEQAKTAFTGYNGYFGTYTVDERAGIVIHHVEGSLLPN